MTDSPLPIDVIPGKSPPRFRWRQTVSTVAGTQTIQMDGRLPPSIEQAVIELIALAKAQAQEIIGLHRLLEQATEQLAMQNERVTDLSAVDTPMGPLPSKHSIKKGKG